MKALTVLTLSSLLCSCGINQHKSPMPMGYVPGPVNHNSYQGSIDNGCTIGGEIPEGEARIYYFECDIRGRF